MTGQFSSGILREWWHHLTFSFVCGFPFFLFFFAVVLLFFMCRWVAFLQDLDFVALKIFSLLGRMCWVGIIFDKVSSRVLDLLQVLCVISLGLQTFCVFSLLL